ncbi:MAG: hypothetical protein GF399_02565 [Candidatus Coatesbacteria bacterium]|nr:hypothetical protein [Candidatus Coatesbacteria bacterium]
MAEPVWGRIEKYGLTFGEGYSIEQGGAGDTVLFDDATWLDPADDLIYEQQLGIAQWNADGDTIEG